MQVKALSDPTIVYSSDQIIIYEANIALIKNDKKLSFNFYYSKMMEDDIVPIISGSSPFCILLELMKKKRTEFYVPKYNMKILPNPLPSSNESLLGKRSYASSLRSAKHNPEEFKFSSCEPPIPFDEVRKISETLKSSQPSLRKYTKAATKKNEKDSAQKKPLSVQDIIEAQLNSALKESKEEEEEEKDDHKKTQFWPTDLRVQFIRLIHKMGRQWQKVSKEIRIKTPEQCRSHAQKYFNNLTNLKDQLAACNGDHRLLGEEIHIKIQQYEDECKKVIYSLTQSADKIPDHEINWTLFPAYLKDYKEGKMVYFLDKLTDICQAISNEFRHYDVIKMEKKESNKIKKKNKQAQKSKKYQMLMELQHHIQSLNVK